MGQLSAKDLANAFWAFAKMDLSNVALIQMLSLRSQRILSLWIELVGSVSPVTVMGLVIWRVSVNS